MNMTTYMLLYSLINITNNYINSILVKKN